MRTIPKKIIQNRLGSTYEGSVVMAPKHSAGYASIENKKDRPSRRYHGKTIVDFKTEEEQSANQKGRIGCEQRL